MSIAVTCPKCQSTFRVKNKYGGKPGTCPVCHAGLQVPAVPANADSTGASSTGAISTEADSDDRAWQLEEFDLDAPGTPSDSSDLAVPSSHSGGATLLEFPCEACGHRLLAAVEHVGRKIRCGECQHKFRIPPTSLPIRPRAPSGGSAVPPPAVQSPAHTPLPDRSSPSADPNPSRPSGSPPASQPPGSARQFAGDDALDPRRDSPAAPRPAASVRRPSMQAPLDAAPVSHEKVQPPQRPEPENEYALARDDIWSELTPRDLQRGTSAESASSPAVPSTPPRRLPPTTYLTDPRPSLESTPSRGSSGTVLLSGCGTLIILFGLVVRTVARFERLSRDDRSGSANQSAPAQGGSRLGGGRGGDSVVEGSRTFDCLAAYCVRGADRNDPNQARYCLDVGVHQVPIAGTCRLAIRSSRNSGLIELGNEPIPLGIVRWDFTLRVTRRDDPGPFTAWVEQTDPLGQRRRISNTITFRDVDVVPPPP